MGCGIRDAEAYADAIEKRRFADLGPDFQEVGSHFKNQLIGADCKLSSLQQRLRRATILVGLRLTDLFELLAFTRSIKSYRQVSRRLAVCRIQNVRGQSAHCFSLPIARLWLQRQLIEGPWDGQGGTTVGLPGQK